jgi:hypothetical protein
VKRTRGSGGREQHGETGYVRPIEEKPRERRRESGENGRRHPDEREQNDEHAPLSLA